MIELKINQCIRCEKIWINGGTNFSKEDLKIIEDLKKNKKIQEFLKIRLIIFESGCPECIKAVGEEATTTMIMERL